MSLTALSSSPHHLPPSLPRWARGRKRASQWAEMLEVFGADRSLHISWQRTDANAAVLPYCAQLIPWHWHNIIVSSDPTWYTIYHDVASPAPEARVPPSVALGLVCELLYTAPVVNLDLWMHVWLCTSAICAPQRRGLMAFSYVHDSVQQETVRAAQPTTALVTVNKGAHVRTCAPARGARLRARHVRVDGREHGACTGARAARARARHGAYAAHTRACARCVRACGRGAYARAGACRGVARGGGRRASAGAGARTKARACLRRSGGCVGYETHYQPGGTGCRMAEYEAGGGDD
ncbi:hypothetical protein GGX14DRAFT_568143 [Mycena pura]|uniref:Uncharacterized protein n=1 Tax=Mycena pura TaxID=153505 RepID=A0AAD6VDK1_9AGAR|nr:hypothetical protein GGX14DRAFT_568143 [Mycena pura]